MKITYHQFTSKFKSIVFIKSWILLLTILFISNDYARASERFLAMWSWHGNDGIWNFAILPDRLEPPWNENEILRAPTIKGVSSAEKYINSLSAQTNICWRDLPPSKLIVFPPEVISKKLIRVAKRRSVNLEIWPTLVE